MGIKLIHKQKYILKETGEIVQIREAPDGSFWYWKDYDSQDRKVITITPDDVEAHVYISYGGIEPLEIGDIVVYLSGGYNSSPSMAVGQVVGFKNARVTVKFHDGQFGTSNIASHNLLIVTESKLRKRYDWIE